jgi:hypothetical protein
VLSATLDNLEAAVPLIESGAASLARATVKVEALVG